MINNVVGGQWALLVYQNRQLLGSLSGTVIGGSATWNKTGPTTTTASVVVTLKILGGTGRYFGKVRHRLFLRHSQPSTFPPTITGTLGLSF